MTRKRSKSAHSEMARVLSIPKHRARRSSPVSIPSRFVFVVVAGPTPWNFSIGKFSTKVSPIFGVMTKRPSGLF